MRHRIKYFFIDLVVYSKALVKLTLARLKHGECFVVESGFCSDTGHFSVESRYTNPWVAVLILHDLNTSNYWTSDGPSSGRIGDGTMWHDDDHYSQAPYGWDELRRDREAEDNEQLENKWRGYYDNI